MDKNQIALELTLVLIDKGYLPSPTGNEALGQSVAMLFETIKANLSE